MLQRPYYFFKEYKGWVISFLAITAIVALTVIFAGPLVNRKAQQLITEKLRSLHDQGILLKFDSLAIDPLSGSIHVKNLLIERIRNRDSLANSSYFKIRTKYLIVGRISLISLLIQRRIKIHSAHLIEPHIIFNVKEELSKTEKTGAFEILVDKLILSNCFLQVSDSIQLQPTFQLFTNITLSDVKISRENISVNWQVGALYTETLEVRLPANFYTLDIKRLRYIASDQLFSLDSLRIKPWFERTTFAQKTGKQTDRISGVIPFLEMKFLTYTILSKPIINIQRVDLQIHLDVYRDKRFPFMKEWSTVLPVEFVYQLPFSLTIDTVKLKDSYVAYTEHQDEGNEAGTVFFDRLQAVIVHITNDSMASAKSAMHAKASFMGEGTLSVDFSFPQKPGDPYFVKGVLSGFPLPKANDMLEPAAKIKIESGMMDIFKFHFWYNDYRSDGSLELNYQNVRVLSLNDKTKKNPVNRFATFLLNTFVVKKNMGERVSDEKKTGKIQFVRDTRRSIFHYWWKSLLSGIKSAYNVEMLKSSKDSNK